MQSPPFPRYLVPPRSKYSPQHHVLIHPQLPFPAAMSATKFHTHTTTRFSIQKFYIVITLHLCILFGSQNEQ